MRSGSICRNGASAVGYDFAQPSAPGRCSSPAQPSSPVRRRWRALLAAANRGGGDGAARPARGELPPLGRSLDQPQAPRGGVRDPSGARERLRLSVEIERAQQPTPSMPSTSSAALDHHEPRRRRAAAPHRDRPSGMPIGCPRIPMRNSFASVASILLRSTIIRRPTPSGGRAMSGSRRGSPISSASAAARSRRRRSRSKASWRSRRASASSA